MKETYGIETSDGLINRVDGQIMPVITEWRNRPLEAVYPIVFLMRCFLKPEKMAKVVHKAVYNILGVNQEGHKDILGFYIAESEGANFWLGVLNDLKARGVEDILIACVDGLNRFPEAISASFPKLKIQLCVVHQFETH